VKLYFAPGACSLAPHIIAREAGLQVDLVKVSFSNDARTAEGRDFYTINPLGAVPALGVDSGELLTETRLFCNILPSRRRNPTWVLLRPVWHAGDSSSC
jgi:glutathione S-transferase